MWFSFFFTGDDRIPHFGQPRNIWPANIPPSPSLSQGQQQLQPPLALSILGNRYHIIHLSLPFSQFISALLNTNNST